MTHDIVVQIASQAPHVPSPTELQQWVSGALAQQNAPAAEITVRIVDEMEAQALNRQYRHKDYATNVLSFAYTHEPLCGDIVVCAPVVNKEAEQYGRDPKARWAHMIIHGTLHLMGFDHQTDVEAEHMERLEGLLLKDLGYSSPYGA